LNSTTEKQDAHISSITSQPIHSNGQNDAGSEWPVRIYRRKQNSRQCIGINQSCSLPSETNTMPTHIQSHGWEKLQALNTSGQSILVKVSPQVGCIIFRRIQVRLNLYPTPSQPLRDNDRNAMESSKTPQKSNTTIEGRGDSHIPTNGTRSTNPTALHHPNTVVIVRRLNRILIQSHQNKIQTLMLRFFSEQDCMDFSDRLIQLNPQQQILGIAKLDRENLSSSLLCPQFSLCPPVSHNGRSKDEENGKSSGVLDYNNCKLAKRQIPFIVYAR
jgi:serine/threonine protein kinase